MSTDPTQREAEVLAWLESTGYSLEMRVARAFGAATTSPLYVDQGRRYVDAGRQERTVRETDVVACWRVWRKPDKWAFLYAVVECKAHSQPFVILGPGAGKESTDVAVLMDLLYTREINETGWLESVAQDELLPVEGTLLEPAAIGHSVVAARKPTLTPEGTAGRTSGGGRSSQPDPAYAAVMAVYSATESFLEHDLEIAHGSVVAAVPIVVTGGELFTARMDEGGQIQVQTAQEASVAMRPSAAPETHRCIIVTEAGLPDLIDRLARTAALLLPRPA